MHMPLKVDHIIEVHIRIQEAFTLESIVRSPRTFKPKDVMSACQNNELVIKDAQPPTPVINLATYVMTDFFAMVHATGLYNRQRNLWESLSKVNSIAITQLKAGLMKKRHIPVYDLAFNDYKGKPLLYAVLITALTEKESPVALLKQSITRARGKNGLRGCFICFPTPFPADVLQFVQKATNTGEPVGRYESIMPSLRVPLDLLEIQPPQDLEPAEDISDATVPLHTFQLIHPDLRKAKTAFQPVQLFLRQEDSEKEPSNISPTAPSNQASQ